LKSPEIFVSKGVGRLGTLFTE